MFLSSDYPYYLYYLNDGTSYRGGFLALDPPDEGSAYRWSHEKDFGSNSEYWSYDLSMRKIASLQYYIGICSVKSSGDDL
jgi:hypothetical protein